MDLKKEEEVFAKGYKLVVGVDEVGRGPLAGPVVAAAVALGPDTKVPDELLEEIKDSKKLSEKKREKLNKLIWENIDYVSVGLCDSETIDRINILEASFLAMKKAISALKTKADYALVDGKFPIKNCSMPQENIIKGDGKIFTIAAASVVAKVVRDRMMEEYARKFPVYGLERHKGYGTKLHMEALESHGPCPIHRRSFAPVERAMTSNSRTRTKTQSSMQKSD